MPILRLWAITMFLTTGGFGAGGVLSIFVLDFAGARGNTIEDAARMAGEAFRKAGIDTDWSICRVLKDSSPPCVLPPGANYLLVEVVPKAFGAIPGETLGLAPGSSSDERRVLSYAFYEPAKSLAESTSAHLSTVLGCIIAHEIGHLLGVQHSKSGVMKGKFELTDLRRAAVGRLGFTTEAAKLLQCAVHAFERHAINVDMLHDD